MASEVIKEKTKLELRHVFATSPQKLWDIWTRPEHIKRWHHPPQFSTSIAETDTKVGGKFKIGMRSVASGEDSVVHGEFIELDEPKKMVYSWQWEHDPSEKSLVTVEFLPYDDNTELVLTHERLSGPESVDGHGEGWVASVANIEELIKNG